MSPVAVGIKQIFDEIAIYHMLDGHFKYQENVKNNALEILNKDPKNINLKRLDLFWVNSDDHYFEWFMKMLKNIDFPNSDKIFNYHIHFIETRCPENHKLTFVLEFYNSQK